MRLRVAFPGPVRAELYFRSITGALSVTFIRSPTAKPEVEPLLLCPVCRTEMRLFGVESENGIRDLYTFECHVCGGLEVRGALVGLPYSKSN
jgi:hypothetical protein